jgi:hypothetical protein
MSIYYIASDRAVNQSVEANRNQFIHKDKIQEENTISRVRQMRRESPPPLPAITWFSMISLPNNSHVFQ